jgi:hypothetical protein
MAFLQNLTDDQTALLGCAGVLLAAFVTMSVSYHVGVIVRGGRTPQERTASRRRSAPATQTRRAA